MFTPRSRLTPDYRRIFFRIIAVILILGAVIALFRLADRYKGYHITIVEPGVYRISVEISASELSDIATRLEHTGQTSYPLRDVRLPNGTIASTSITSQHIDQLIGTERSICPEDTYTIVNYWRLSEHSGTHTTSSTITMFLTFSYRDIAHALDTATAERTSGCYMQDHIILPNGSEGAAWLSSTELSDIRRRMHCVGATQIILPFYWSLDGTVPAYYEHTF